MNDDLTSTLWELALAQRWFSGRHGRPVAVETGEDLAAPSGDGVLRPAVLVVEFPDGHTERYLIPLLLRPGAAPVDVCDDAGILLDLLHAQAPGFERLRDVPAGLPARRFTGEQSNTSVFFGDALLAKVFRRLEPGVNLDVELHRALSGSGVAAELYGVWRADDTDYAVFLEALDDPADGFQLATRYAREGMSFEAEASAVGEALATVHRLLAERLPVGTVDGSALADDCRRRFAEVAEAADEARRFEPAARRVFARIPRGELYAQRIHGDCHLGQVLRTGGRWVFVDFEGEPLKSLDERRAPDSPLRDVAGVLRSIDYAAVVGGALPGWRSATREAFLTGYGLEAGAADPLLAAYETDKAGYEVLYEARYRPHMVRVPLDFLAALPEGDD